MFPSKRCFEKYNKKDRPQYSQKNYDAPILITPIRGYEWGLVFSVICPYFLLFAVILAIFLMFTVSGRNTVKCLECFFFQS